MNKPITFKWAPAGASRADLRVGLVQEGRLLAGPSWPAEERQATERWMKAATFTGKAGSATCPPIAAPVVLIGTGPKADFHPARWLRGWAAAGRILAKAGSIRTASFEWPAEAELPMEIAPLAGLAAEGLARGAYSFDDFKKESPEYPFTIEWQGRELAASPVRTALERARIANETLRAVKAVANQPANALGPMDLAAWARKQARAVGLDCRIWNTAALARERCGALLAVAQGSRRPACLIRLAHRGRRGMKPLVVVGKAMMFDTGGISLKPGKGMEWMKYDKCGGMAALATVLLAARLKLPRPVIAYVPAAENMPGGNATRPGDIVTARNGKSIEVLNTDAEGRLMLADALSFAVEEKPAAIVDIATLTGAVIVALGHEATGVMGNSDRLMLDLIQSGEAVGERLWQLPLWPEYDEMIQGTFADIQNMGDGSAGTIAGGAFLKQFVPDSVPWAHLDIAGTAWLEADKPYGAPGATLVPARLLADWAARVRDED